MFFYSFLDNAVPSGSPPVFVDNYNVKGILLLPYAEINEPFQAFYDKNSGKSRIDYYGGMCSSALTKLRILNTLFVTLTLFSILLLSLFILLSFSKSLKFFNDLVSKSPLNLLTK